MRSPMSRTWAPVFFLLSRLYGKGDFRNVLNDMRLGDDLPWTIPIVLDVGREEASGSRKVMISS